MKNNAVFHKSSWNKISALNVEHALSKENDIETGPSPVRIGKEPLSK